MVRAKGLEPPRALGHQDPNLGRLVPFCPVSWGIWAVAGLVRPILSRPVPSCTSGWVAIGRR